MIVDACLRDGRGGSPTAVLADRPMSDAERRRVPARAGTSHAVFIGAEATDGDRPRVPVRFFTTHGELPGCGHGTVAALAFLADRARAMAYEATLEVGGRSLPGRAVRDADGFAASFEPGAVSVRAATERERELVLPALGVGDRAVTAPACVASLGRPRMLVLIHPPSALAALTPDRERLRSACEGLNLLGCYAHSTPGRAGRAAARMFAPAIGVPEDIANANSTACLAAALYRGEGLEIAVDMGDMLGCPSTIIATARPTPAGPVIGVGGVAALAR
jgi:PhzF family phenazine biosynthesis protein